MIVKELISIFKSHFIPIDFLSNCDKKEEVTKELLIKNKIPKEILEKYESMPLWNIRGIGPSKASELWKKGARPNNLIKYWEDLTFETQMALKYKPIEKIPHLLIPILVESFTPDKVKFVITGSYRRLKDYSGDIDLVYKGTLENLDILLNEKHKKNWIPVSQGHSKLSGFYRHKGKTYGVDIWCATPENYHAMVLYSTGSKNFNIRMRHIAKLRSMKLSQYGLFDLKGNKITTKSEKEIFEILKMKYYKPNERNV